MKKILTLVAFVVSLFAAASTAQAATLRSVNIKLDDARASVTSPYTFNFSHNTTATLGKVEIDFCTTPSGDCTGTNTNVDAVNTISARTGYDGTWTVSGSSGKITLQKVGGQVVTADTFLSATIAGIDNGALNSCDNDADSSSDTCYVRITTYAEDDTTAVDTGTGSYTRVAAVTVTARVDPTFKFVVGGMASGVVKNEITTSVSSAYNTLPFGNLTAGTPKYAGHLLRVTTNTQGGYTVTAQMQTAMTGVYASNNIDPFVHAWTSPAAWTEPTGTSPSVNTGWIGANTTDTRVSNWSGTTAQLFGAISGTEATVMRNTISDNGSSPVYVTYAIEANVFQPADSYTGTLFYNALPTY